MYKGVYEPPKKDASKQTEKSADQKENPHPNWELQDPKSGTTTARPNLAKYFGLVSFQVPFSTLIAMSCIALVVPSEFEIVKIKSSDETKILLQTVTREAF